MKCLKQRPTTFFSKGPDSKYLEFVSHIVPVTNTSICKQETSECAHVQRKLYSHTQKGQQARFGGDP
jgi:hypothetical protein